jgi:hypothetical protein
MPVRHSRRHPVSHSRTRRGGGVVAINRQDLGRRLRILMSIKAWPCARHDVGALLFIIVDVEASAMSCVACFPPPSCLRHATSPLRGRNCHSPGAEWRSALALQAPQTLFICSPGSRFCGHGGTLLNGCAARLPGLARFSRPPTTATPQQKKPPPGGPDGGSSFG